MNFADQALDAIFARFPWLATIARVYGALWFLVVWTPFVLYALVLAVPYNLALLFPKQFGKPRSTSVPGGTLPKPRDRFGPRPQTPPLTHVQAHT